MVVVIDPRPTYFGDRIVITGTCAANDTIDLTSMVASIDSCVITPNVNDAEAGAQSFSIDTTGAKILCSAANIPSKFMIVGRRS